jgi:hypothetical protein
MWWCVVLLGLRSSTTTLLSLRCFTYDEIVDNANIVVSFPLVLRPVHRCIQVGSNCLYRPLKRVGSSRDLLIPAYARTIEESIAAWEASVGGFHPHWTVLFDGRCCSCTQLRLLFR